MSVMQEVSTLIEKVRGKPELLAQVSSMNKTFQFDLEGGEKFFVKLENGDIVQGEGTVESPSATIQAAPDLMLDLMTGKADAIKSFMSGKLKVRGDIFAAQKITDMFRKA
ncbi:MAG: SCP2 sterol-binding domain-containing protein [Candidatus Thermoplasmatota archaeon]|nr:SCP2 sterol-binding domain-containing protein [Candidatus Thermoplasmatota archaeon]